MSGLAMSEVKCFRVPKYLVRSGALAELSGDALRLFLFICDAWYRTRFDTINVHISAIAPSLRLQRSQIRPLSEELSAIGMISFECCGDKFVFNPPEFEPTNPN